MSPKPSKAELRASRRSTAGEPAAPGSPFLSPPEQPDELGRLGPYRVLAELGRGGMGVVFRAEELDLGRQVALKVMQPRLAADPRAKARFVREAKAQAAVEHDGVVPIYRVGEANGVPFLAMPLLRGRTLKDGLEAHPRPPTPGLVRVGYEVAVGLAAAHAAGLIHRDIKPANVWLEDPSGRARILDFGLARAADPGAPPDPADRTDGAPETGGKATDHLTRTGAVVGTPAYMSPEQAAGAAVDHRTDLWSLGVVLYEMATGQVPFAGASGPALLYAIGHVEPVPAHQLAPDRPPALCDLIRRLLAKDPNERPASAAAVAAELAAIGRALSAPVLELPPEEPRRRSGRRRAWLAGAVAATAALVAVGLLVWAILPEPQRGPGPGADPTGTGGANPGPPVVDAKYQPTKGLRFRPTGDPERDKGAQVRFDGFKFTMNDAPFTLEGFVIAEPAQPADGPYRGCLYFWNLANIAFNEDENGHRWCGQVIHRQGGPFEWPRVTVDTAAVLGRRTHLALVIGKDGADRYSMTLFVNGRLSGGRQLNPDQAVFEPPVGKHLPREFCLGHRFTGVIEEARVSKGARYDKTFVPEPLKADADTLAFYPLDATEGAVVADASGNGKHGTIRGDVTWVRRK